MGVDDDGAKIRIDSPELVSHSQSMSIEAAAPPPPPPVATASSSSSSGSPDLVGPKSLSSPSNLHIAGDGDSSGGSGACLAQDDDLSFLAIKTELSILRDRDSVHHRLHFSTDVVADNNNYASESSATNTNASSPPPTPRPPPSSAPNPGVLDGSSAQQPHAPPTKHFRFSGDFTLRNNASVLSAFASSMGNLSDAWGDEGAKAKFSNAASPKSPSSSNSILTELPTRFSFESSSTTSSSSSHLSLLLQKPTTAPRRIYQNNHGGSFDRRDLLTSLTTFHCEDFESYIANRYGSVEKLMSYATQSRPHEEASKGAVTDLSLSLSPINRRRDLLGPAISL